MKVGSQVRISILSSNFIQLHSQTCKTQLNTNTRSLHHGAACRKLKGKTGSDHRGIAQTSQPADRRKTDEARDTNLGFYREGENNCMNPTRHKDLFPDPEIIRERDIPFRRVVQRVGEMIVLLLSDFIYRGAMPTSSAGLHRPTVPVAEPVVCCPAAGSTSLADKHLARQNRFDGLTDSVVQWSDRVRDSCTE